MVTATRSLLGRERRGQREGSQDRQESVLQQLAKSEIVFLFFCFVYSIPFS